LCQAAQAGHLALVEEMLSLGADVDAKDISGATPLRLAQSFGHKKVEVTLFA
jgi:ankyrin repeat protein